MAAPEGSILPLEMLQEIFSYLEVQQIEESVAPVCRLWRDASLLPVVRRRLSLTGNISPSDAEEMLRLSPQLKELKISDAFPLPRRYTNDVLLAASKHNPELRVLKVHGPLSDKDLAAVAQCAQLRTLSLRHSFLVSDDGVVHLARLRNLVKLDLLGGKRVTPAGWRRLFSTCDWPHLRELTLNLYGGDEVHFDRLPASLRSLTLYGSVSDMDLAAVAQCDQLRTLSLPYAPKVTADGVVHLARLRNLVKLELWGGERVTPAGWRRLFSMSDWPHLRELSLNLYGRDEDHFERLPTSLRSLTLNGPVLDMDLAAVAQCDQLRTLSLDDARKVTADGVVHLARLRNLVKLDLLGANRVTPAGWRRLFSTCDWPLLRELSLYLFEDDEEDEEPQVHFDRLPTSLRSLKLNGYVSDVDLAAVAQCDQLRTLSLRNHYNRDYTLGKITNDGVLQLAPLSLLEKLELLDANRVTPAGWRRLFSTCDWPLLRELSLHLYGGDEDHFERLPASLRSLELNGYVSDVDLAAVAQCDQLRTLSLGRAPGVSDDGVVHLARLRNLVK